MKGQSAAMKETRKECIQWINTDAKKVEGRRGRKKQGWKERNDKIRRKRRKNNRYMATHPEEALNQ
jgi:hypothetical protein